MLESVGMSEESITEAEAAGTDQLLAIDAVVLPERGRYTLDEVAEKVGVPTEVIRAFWRASGFVEAGDEDQTFSKRDVAIMKSLVSLTGDGLIDEQLALQVARVVGLSMAQVATAVIDAGARRGDDRTDEGDGDGGDEDDRAADAAAALETGSLAVRAGELLPFMSDVIDYSFRRHLRAAARRQVAVASSADGSGRAVGFADLVRFTEISAQLDEYELAELVGWFDQTVNTTVVRHGGRVVKMIGDGAMYTAVDPAAAAQIALDLAAAVAEQEDLSGARVGVAAGPVVARDGDLYGPVVNMASRLGTIGRGGAVNVSQEVRDAIVGDARFALRSLGTRPLRHIGEVRVYRLKSTASAAAGGA